MMEVVRFVPFVIGQLGHLLIYSYEGQKIINHSLELCQKIYNGLWYTIPVNSQRLLLFALRKTIEPSVAMLALVLYGIVNFQRAIIMEQMILVTRLVKQLFNISQK
ncbi:hypothetical protein EAI_15170 [Harpegnathos saltator]|uniref:Uncharacterized protein n=1 Tax=Harpegnathos saltator TaxID=610380 RepID=E2C721_HARSA|nr:hypothetical protein EAI_15170 [Harpegnathos saltator]